jgi:hypothetical protein
MTPGSFGPWFCALFVNTTEDSKKQTHLIAHTFPHLACDMLNRTGAASNDRWVILLKIGPFDSWGVALAFLELWMSRKRGKQRRLERGVELYATYRDTYNLMLWSQSLCKDEAVTKSSTALAQLDKEEQDEWALSVPPPPKRSKSDEQQQQQPRRSVADIQRAFANGSGLTMQGLVTICSDLRVGIK